MKYFLPALIILISAQSQADESRLHYTGTFAKTGSKCSLDIDRDANGKVVQVRASIAKIEDGSPHSAYVTDGSIEGSFNGGIIDVDSDEKTKAIEKIKALTDLTVACGLEAEKLEVKNFDKQDMKVEISVATNPNLFMCYYISKKCEHLKLQSNPPPAMPLSAE